MHEGAGLRLGQGTPGEASGDSAPSQRQTLGATAPRSNDQKGRAMNLGIANEIIRQEAVERAMARYRANQAREQRLQAARERRGVGPRPVAGRKISKEEAVQLLIDRGHRRGAARLLHSLLGGRTVR